MSQTSLATNKEPINDPESGLEEKTGTSKIEVPDGGLEAWLVVLGVFYVLLRSGKISLSLFRSVPGLRCPRSDTPFLGV